MPSADPAVAPRGARETISIERLLGFGWVLVVVLVALTYLPVIDGEFIFDDISNIVEGWHIHRVWPPTYLFNNRRPIAMLSFAINWALGGENPVGYRLVNVAIHTASGLFLFGLVRRTLRLSLPERFSEARACGVATSIACLWAVHPLHTSAVTYVAHRYESLAGMFMIATFYAFARARTDRAPARWNRVTVLFCALGMATKEIAVVVPPLLLLYDRAFVGPDWRRAAKARAAVHLAAWSTIALPIALTFNTTRGPSQGFDLPGLGPLDYARSELGAVTYYLRLAVWPHPLSVDYYDWPIARSLGDVAVGASVVGALVLATAIAIVKRPKIGFLGAAFFAILAPTSSFVPLQHELVAERRMYVPLAAVVAAVVIGADAMLDRARARALVKGAVAGLATIALACVTVVRNGDFLTAITLYEHETRVRPNCARAHSWYGYHLARAGRLEDGLREANRALEIDPGVYRAFHVAGSIAYTLGRGPMAARYLGVAVAQDPQSIDVRDLAVGAFDMVGDVKRAIALLRGTIALVPGSARHYQRLAWYLATDEALRKGPEALDLAQRATALAGPAHEIRYDETLAAAYAAAGRFDQAETVARQALDRARAAASSEQISRLEKAIDAYRSARPFTVERRSAAR